MLEIRLLPSTAKVFPNEAPAACPPRFVGMKNEVISFQVAYRNTEPGSAPERHQLRLEVDSPIKDNVHVRRVKYVPVRMAAFSNRDEHYINNAESGLYPDPLIEIPPHGLRVLPKTWETLWVDVSGDLPAGDHIVALRLFDESEGSPLLGAVEVQIHVIDAELPKQTLVHTKWFHSDCLADYYEVEIFSEKHWQIIENFVKCAVDHGINTILTPIHTPPLDTRVGTYRPTVQLVDVTYIDGKYTFGFDKLRRWVEMCKRCGVEWYEMAHLFSQWGAKCAPQVVATTENGLERIFGWDDAGTGEAYGAFIDAYLPALLDELEALGIADRCLFHISDEPHKEHLEGYLKAKAMVKKHLRGQKLIDALSDVAFYDSGAVENPVPANNRIEPFLERNIDWLWAYYCCGQCVDVCNIFLAMSGARTRIFGTQLYKYNIAGILQWGFNFYYSQYSDYLIDPWLDLDNDCFGQAGDAFQVYPGRGGKPVVSMRMMFILEAMQDMRAMQLLENLTDRETVLKIIDDGIEPITFSKYPHEDAFIHNLRERINREIEKRL